MADYQDIRGLRVKYLSADPSETVAGEVWYNSTTGTLRSRLVSEAWISSSPMTTGRRYLAGFGTPTTAVAAGGASSPPAIVADVEEYNGTGWTETTNINTARKTLQGFGTTALALVFAGETSPTVITAATEEWNGTTWTEVADLTTARFSGGSTTGTTNTGGLCIGGSVGPASSNAVEEWTSGLATITFTNS